MTNIAGWILAVVLAFVFLLAGGSKLIGTQAMVGEFAHIGAGQWFRFVTGFLEVSGAIGLSIAAVMVGATGVNLWVLHVPSLAGVTGTLLALALLFAWLRRPRGR